ncbi:MAG: choice-of-anchor D domain-containing protein, partial [bacterium]
MRIHRRIRGAIYYTFIDEVEFTDDGPYTYDDYGAVYDVRYFYKITILVLGVFEEWGPVWAFPTNVPHPPAPTQTPAISAEYVGNSTITVNLTEGSEYSTSFEAHYDHDVPGEPYAYSREMFSYGCNLTQLSKQTYYIAAKGFNDYGSSPYSAEVAIVAGFKGDVDENDDVNVLDVLRTVNIILGVGDAPSEYENWAADCNGDGMINLEDVYCVVYIILGIEPSMAKHFTPKQNITNPSEASVSKEPDALMAKSLEADSQDVSVRSSPITLASSDSNSGEYFLRKSLGSDEIRSALESANLNLSWVSGDTHQVTLENSVPVWGVQLHISYDPGEMTPGEPTKTSRCIDLDLYYNIIPDSNEIRILIFAVAWNSIAAGDGPIVFLPADGPGNMCLTTVYLMDLQGNYVTPIINDAPIIPHNPSPVDGATSQSINVNLSWGGGDCDGGDVVSYDVYFAANDSTPDSLLYTGQDTTYDPEALNYCTQYFWRVKATDNYGSMTEGPVWSFTTEEAPEISLSASSHNFGNVRVGESTNWSFTISNNGCADLTVNNITSNHSDFVVTSPTFPKTIPADGNFVVTVRFTPSTTGTKSGTLTITSNDPDEETRYVSLSGTGTAPDIALSSNSHDFGDVLVDSSSSWLFTISNVGNADLAVDSVTSDHPNFVVASPAFPQTVAPDDSISAEVIFTPSTTGLKTGSLTLFSDDPDEGTVNISLSGRGVVPDIAVSTTDHDFGTVVVDSSASWILTLSNVGTSDLTVQSVTSDHTDFVVASPTFPHIIGAGDSAAVTIVFTPSSEGSRAAQLTIMSDDPDEGTVYVSLNGSGGYPDIDLLAASHDYGFVLVGGASDWTLTVDNVGVADLTVISITSDHIDFVVSSPSFPQTIGAGNNLAV